MTSPGAGSSRLSLVTGLRGPGVGFFVSSSLQDLLRVSAQRERGRRGRRSPRWKFGDQLRGRARNPPPTLAAAPRASAPLSGFVAVVVVVVFFFFLLLRFSSAHCTWILTAGEFLLIAGAERPAFASPPRGRPLRGGVRESRRAQEDVSSVRFRLP